MHQSSDSMGAFGNHEVVTDLFNGRSRITAPKKYKQNIEKEDEFINSLPYDWSNFIHTALWLIRLIIFVQVVFDLYNERLSYVLVGLLFIIALNTSFCWKRGREK